jgi:hypothetical protein
LSTSTSSGNPGAAASAGGAAAAEEPRRENAGQEGQAQAEQPYDDAYYEEEPLAAKASRCASAARSPRGSGSRWQSCCETLIGR